MADLPQETKHYKSHLNAGKVRLMLTTARKMLELIPQGVVDTNDNRYPIASIEATYDQAAEDAGRRASRASAPSDALPGWLIRDRGVGPWVRWLAVLSLIVDPPGRALSEGACPDEVTVMSLLKDHMDPDELFRPGGLSDLFWFSSVTPPGEYVAGDAAPFKAILRAFNKTPLRRRLKPLTVAMLMERRAPMSAGALVALDRFIKWLTYGVVPPVERVLPVAVNEQGLYRDKKWSPRVEKVIHLLVTDDVGTAPITNVRCTASAQSQDAFIAEVCRGILQVGDDNRGTRPAVLHIPIRSTGVDMPLLTPADALAAIASAFEIPIDIDELRSTDHVFNETLEQVRRGCTIFRTVILLDGVDEAHGRHSPLLSLMRGRRWDSLLRVLCQVDADTVVTNRLATAIGARVLVLSNEKMGRLEGWVDHAAAKDIDGPDGFHLPLTSEVLGTPSWADLVSGTKKRAKARRAERLQLLLLAFVACSPDGASYGALHRAARNLIDLLGRVGGPLVSPTIRDELTDELSRRTIVQHCDDLLNEATMEITRSKDEPLPSVTPLEMRYEWQADPTMLDVPDKQEHVKIHFRDETYRQEFIRCVLTDPGVPGSEHSSRRTAGIKLGQFDIPLGNALWRLINASIAIETLRQATSQMRHTPRREVGRVAATRRLCQLIYHLRAAGDIDIIGASDGEEYVSYLSIPRSKTKRLRFSYAFLLRQVLDGGTYRLSRAFARPDLRVQLIALFLVKDVRLLERHQPHEDQTDDFVKALEEGIKAWKDRGKDEGRELLPDILVALATAALDAFDFPVAEWAINEIAKGEAELESALIPLAWSGDSVDERKVISSWSAGMGLVWAKLRFDYLDSMGRVDDAETHCIEQLKLYGISGEVLASLEQTVQQFMDTSADGDFSITRLEAALGNILRELLKNSRRGELNKTAASDLLFRLADITATKIDEESRECGKALALRGFLRTFCRFFLADRLRSEVAGKSGYGVNWRALSAKPNRVYVRSCLKIARLLVEQKPKTGEPKDDVSKGYRPDALYRSAVGFVQHATHRANVYTRHLHTFQRERISALLLMSSIVRTWVLVARHAPEPLLLESLPALDHARHYVDGAEELLLELEVPTVLARRHWLERVSLWVGLAKAAPDAELRETYSKLVQADLETATRLSKGASNYFWGPLVERQRKRWTYFLDPEKEGAEAPSAEQAEAQS
ncbi:hypothetical protein ACS5PN_26550 [Roseateles sp. NT4]|uniref:hypothetical protein n=1 Tax=Roseateles sp. NT4 TaxID=3453715 RepID=UPI003EEC1790